MPSIVTIKQAHSTLIQRSIECVEIIVYNYSYSVITHAYTMKHNNIIITVTVWEYNDVEHVHAYRSIGHVGY